MRPAQAIGAALIVVSDNADTAFRDVLQPVGGVPTSVRGSCGSCTIDGGTGTGSRHHIEAATVRHHAKAHAGQAAGHQRHTGAVEAGTVVLNADHGQRCAIDQAHADLRCARVLGHVGQGLLHHAVGGEPHVVGQVDFVERGVHLDFQALGKFGAQPLECGCEPEIGQGRWLQVFDDAALQSDTGIERTRQMPDALEDFRWAALQAAI